MLDNIKDELDRDLRRNPEMALDLIQEMLDRTTSSDNETGIIGNISMLKGEGDLYMVTVQTVRTDVHMVRAKDPEAALEQAQEASSNDNVLSRRHETLNPTVFRVPTIEEVTDDENSRVAMVAKEQPVTKKKRGSGAAMNIPTNNDDPLMDQIAKFLQEQADEYD